MDPLVARLAEICRREPTAEKSVVLPSVSIGLSIGERLARAGRPWINLRFATPAQIADQFAGPRLVARGVARLWEEVGPALVTRLLQDLPGESEPYFRRLADAAILFKKPCGGWRGGATKWMWGRDEKESAG